MKYQLITLVAAAAFAACTPEKSFTISPGGGGGGGGLNTILVSPSAPGAGDLVTFDSGLLGAGDRAWSFGDGTTATGTVVTHAFGLDGSYDIELIVDDGAGSVTEHKLRLVVGGGDPDVRMRP